MRGMKLLLLANLFLFIISLQLYLQIDKRTGLSLSDAKEWLFSHIESPKTKDSSQVGEKNEGKERDLPDEEKEKWLEVILKEQLVSLQVGDESVNSLVISTGRPNYETKPDSYTIENKLPTTGNSDLDWTFDYWVGVYWIDSYQIGFHALPKDSQGNLIWEDKLGKPISYGSILLSEKDAKILYDFCEVGMKVVIK